MPPYARSDHERHLAAARTSLGEETFAAVWASGQTIPVDQMIDEALGEEGKAAELFSHSPRAQECVESSRNEPADETGQER